MLFIENMSLMKVYYSELQVDCPNLQPFPNKAPLGMCNKTVHLLRKSQGTASSLHSLIRFCILHWTTNLQHTVYWLHLRLTCCQLSSTVTSVFILIVVSLIQDGMVHFWSFTITAITYSILFQSFSLMHQQRADYPLSLSEIWLRNMWMIKVSCEWK